MIWLRNDFSEKSSRTWKHDIPTKPPVARRCSKDKGKGKGKSMSTNKAKAKAKGKMKGLHKGKDKGKDKNRIRVRARARTRVGSRTSSVCRHWTVPSQVLWGNCRTAAVRMLLARRIQTTAQALAEKKGFASGLFPTAVETPSREKSSRERKRKREREI